MTEDLIFYTNTFYIHEEDIKQHDNDKMTQNNNMITHDK